jgi:predicted RNA-binding Zn ribbon-like protein
MVVTALEPEMNFSSTGEPFRYVGGRVCLDFIDTVSGRLPNPRSGRRDYVDQVEIERLVDFGDLLSWARGANLLTKAELADLEVEASKAPASATRVLNRARGLREAMYRVFKAAIEGWHPEPADMEILNRELGMARSQERLIRTSEGFGWSWSGSNEAGLDRVLYPILRSAAELLTSDELDRVAQCGGEDCHWLFLDTSRNRSRRWCMMAECGNRAKVRRFRERQ